MSFAEFDFSPQQRAASTAAEEHIISLSLLAAFELVRPDDKPDPLLPPRPRRDWVLDDIFTRVSINDIFDPTVREIYATMKSMRKANKPIYVETVAQACARRGKLTRDAAIAMISKIQHGESVAVSISGYEYMCSKVRRNAALRRALHLWAEHYDELSNGTADDDAIAVIGEAMLAIQNAKDGMDWRENNPTNKIAKFIGEKEKQYEATPEFIKENSFLFPWPSLTKMTNPMGRAEVWTIGAFSGIGKTTFACNVAAFLSSQGRRVQYITGEEEEEDIYGRIVSDECDIHAEQVSKKMGRNKFSLEEWGSLINWSDNWYDEAGNPGGRYINVWSTKEMDTIESIVRNASAHKELDVLVIDHIQTLSPLTGSNNKSRMLRQMTRFDEIEDVIKTLHTWARRYQFLCIVLSQGTKDRGNRDNDGGLTVDSFYGPSALINYSHGVIALTPDPNDPKQQKTFFKVLKCRKGNKGQITVRFDKVHQRFREDPQDNMFPASAPKDEQKNRKQLPKFVQKKIEDAQQQAIREVFREKLAEEERE